MSLTRPFEELLSGLPRNQANTRAIQLVVDQYRTADLPTLNRV